MILKKRPTNRDIPSGMVVVVLVHSHSEAGAGRTDYQSLGLSLSDKQDVDPVLLTWVVAVELKKMPRSKVRAVFPVFSKGR